MDKTRLYGTFIVCLAGDPQNPKQTYEDATDGPPFFVVQGFRFVCYMVLRK
jgi:hypothetical protein